MHASSSKRRSKSSEMFYKLGVLKDFAKFSFTGKHLCRSPLIKFKAWRPTSLKQRPRHKCFSVNFCKFFKNTYFVENVLTILLKTEASRATIRVEACQKFDFLLYRRAGFLAILNNYWSKKSMRSC